MSTNSINVQWVTEESEARTFAASALGGGATVSELKRWEPGIEDLDDYSDAMFEPLSVVVLIVAAGWLIRRIADMVADLTRPDGLLIDTRDGVVVRPLPKADRGTLVVVSGQGVQVFTPDRRDEALAALGPLLAAAGG